MTMISMTIQATTPEEFRTILLGLLNSGPGAKGPVNEDKPAPTPAPKPAVAKAKPEPKQETKPSDEPKTETPPQETKAETGEPVKEKPKKAEPKTEAKKAEPKAEKGEEAATPTGDAPTLPDNIRNTNTMRDLLVYLSEHGVDSPDAMVAACKVLQKEVPILAKVPNLEERVRRALEVLALFPTEDAQA